ncbi:MAG: recombinase family protein, partial [Alphaproteobacteria bacterium]|nr:recombinase family protein [Alphaproteobacteria bacterium]
VINEEQAVVIRKIYKLYLEGLSTHTIAKILTEEGIKTPKGKDKWSQSTVLSILTNEKYSGNAVLQKTYTESFLTHKSVKNDGRLPQYYVEDSHPAIVSKEIFELVQQERERRKKTEGHYSGHNIFSSKIICGECGHFYGSKLWHSTDKYRCTVYRCNQKYKKGEGHIKCGTPHLKEEQIKACFVLAVNELIKNKNEIITNLETAKKLLCDNEVIEKECGELQKELNVIVNKVQLYISENARVVQDQAEYRSRYNELVGKYESLKTQIEEKEQLISDNIAKSRIFDVFIKELKKQQGLVTEFDENLWCSLVESMTVYSKEKIVVRFKNGTEIITAK